MKKNIFKKADKANWFLGLFIILFLVMVARAFLVEQPGAMMVNEIDGQPVVISNKPVEFTFSDVLRRAGDIKTITIRNNDATGVLKDGTNPVGRDDPGTP